jgi:hypothetical protein
MSRFKYIILLLLCLQGIAGAQVKPDIYLATGVLTAERNTDEALKSLRNQIRSANPGLFNEEDFKAAYNTSDGFWDFIEAASQLFAQNGWSMYWNSFVTAVNGSLAQLYIDYFKNISNNHNIDLTEQIKNYKNSINAGNLVIVIAHSQGNYFTNEAYDTLSKCQQRSFYMLGVANPADHVSGMDEGRGYLATLDNDPITYVPSSMKASIINSERFLFGPQNNIVDLPHVKYHYFDYYSQTYAVTKSIIDNFPMLAANHYTPEKISFPHSGIITVGLIWDDQEIDMDLEAGMSFGTKDISDVCQPIEHFYVASEGDVLTGTYHVYVRNSSGADEDQLPQNVYLAVNTLGEAITFDFNITASDMLNIGHVADIIISEEKTLEFVSIPVGAGNPPKVTRYGGSSSNSNSGGGTVEYAQYVYDLQSRLKQALLGPLSNAAVELSEAADFQAGSPFYVSATTGGESLLTSGLLHFPGSVLETLDDKKLYVVSVIGGDDIDADDDGILDSVATPSSGRIRAILTGKRLKNENFKVNILSEVAFQLTENMLNDELNTTAVAEKLDGIAQKLLVADVNNDGVIDYDDILRWLPMFDKDKLLKGYNTSYQPIAEKIYRNEEIYNDAYALVSEPLLRAQTLHVFEDAAAGAVIGKVHVDLYEGNATSFTLSGAKCDYFEILQDGTVTLSALADLDYETVRSYELHVTAYIAEEMFETTLTITIDDIIDAPVLGGFTSYIDENSPKGTAVGRLYVDPGLGAVSEITLQGDGSENFTADVNGSVTVSAKAALDYETRSNFILQAVAQNEYGHSLPASLKINLQNVLDVPELQPFSARIDENATAGTIIGMLEFNGGESGISQMVLSGEGHESFTIDVHGVISLSEDAGLDYEKVAVYELSARAINVQGSSLPAAVTISLNDIPDGPLYPLHAYVNEDATAGTLIGQVFYEEDLNQIVSMELGGTGSEKFDIDEAGNITLREYVQLDFESVEKYTLKAQAYSQTDASNIVDVTIDVIDVDEYAEAGLGRWGDANVGIYRLEENGTKTLLFSETTSYGGDIDAIGLFDSHRLDLEPERFYLYEVSGGTEYDADNDGIIDGTPTPNGGMIHAVLKGSWVRHLAQRMRINLMTEVYYQWASDEMQNYDPDALEAKLLRNTGTVIDQNINGDSRYNVLDALLYDPLLHSYAWNEYLLSPFELRYIAAKLYANDQRYGTFIRNALNENGYTYTLGQAVLSADGTMLFNTDGDGLVLIDLAGGSEPELILEAEMRRLAISGDGQYLFIQQRECEYEVCEELSTFMRILDITDPYNPVERSKTLVESFYLMKLSRDETRLFIAPPEWENGSLRMIDVSDRQNPFAEGELELAGVTRDVVLSRDGSTAYVAGSAAGLQIVDVSEPAGMKVIGEYTPEGLVQRVVLSADETKAFVVVNSDVPDDYYGRGNVHVVDITDKNAPVLHADLNLTGAPLSALALTSDGTTMIVSASSPDYREKIYEIAGDAEAAVLLGETATNYYTSSDDFFFTEGETVVLAVSYYKIDIIDISDPSSPVVIESIELNSPPS